MEKIIVERAGRLSAREIIKYLWRVNLFLDKCSGNGKVTVRNTGEEVRIVPGPATENTVEALKAFRDNQKPFRGRYAVNVQTANKENLVLPISALAKTEEFGGGAGVAGGADLTRVVEASQCIVCAQLQYGENGFESSVSLGKGETIENILAEKEQLDDTWKAAIDAIGETLAGRFTPGVWHWQDSFVKSIQVIYANLDDKLPGTFDRYNPADIWYTDKNYEYISEVGNIRNVHTLADLTGMLNALYQNGTAVGISLKKTTNPELEDYTGAKRETKFDLEDVEVKERNSGTLYINIPFKFNGEENLCQIRKDGFNYRATVKATKDQEHYDGSVGKGIILHCLGKITDNTDLCDPKFWIKKREQEQEEYILNNPEKFDQEDVDEAEDILEGVYPIDVTKEPELFDKDRMSATDQAIADALDNIVALLKDVGDNGRKEFLGRLLRYAWSIHTDSCDFLKVHSKKEQAES